MNQKENMIDSFYDEIKGYLMQFVYLEDIRLVYDDLNSKKDMFDNSPNFVLIVESALIDAYMITFMRLYDKSKQTKNIPQLIMKCRKNLSLFEDKETVEKKLKEFESKLEEEDIKDTIEVLRKRRDTLYAHNDQKYFGKNMTNDESYLPMYKLIMLMNFTNEVLDFICSKISFKSEINTKYNGDLEKLCSKVIQQN